MATQFVSRAFLSVDGIDVKCEEIGYRLTADGHDTVKTMNRRNRAEGYVDGIVMAELNVVVPVRRGSNPVNFEELMKSGTLFTSTIEYEGGAVATFRDCKIKDIDSPSRHGEGLKKTMSVDSLDFDFDDAA